MLLIHTQRNCNWLIPNTLYPGFEPAGLAQKLGLDYKII
jgi:hypothetical protein